MTSLYGEGFLNTCAQLRIKPPSDVLVVRIGRQEMDHFRDDRHRRTYQVSTGKRPPSCIENSLGTPLGLHRVADKIGDGAPLGMVFRGRRAVGKPYWELSAEENTPNLVTTRILRLRGLEEGKNTGPGCDSYDRYIYIHGTNHEDRIGRPDTSGCVALRNDEVIELFDDVPEGALLWIE